MEWLTVVRTCRPEKPGVGLTRQSRCPERTRAYYMEAAAERDIHWFNWQLRETTFHIKNYRNQRKQWIYLLENMWIKYRMFYNVLTCKILTYLHYDRLPHPRIERLIPLGAYDNLDYRTVDCARICRLLTHKLLALGYPVVEIQVDEMDVYLSYYCSSILLSLDADHIRSMYRTLEANKIVHKWRILYSHMKFLGYSLSMYNYTEGYLHKRYFTERADYYFVSWVIQTQLTGEPFALAEAWFNRMKRPSVRKTNDIE
jgi:hypothetical protein